MSLRKNNKDRIMIVDGRFVRRAYLASNDLIEKDMQPLGTKYLLASSVSNCSITKANTSDYPDEPISDLDYDSFFKITSSGVATGDWKVKTNAYGMVITAFALDMFTIAGNKTDTALISFYGYPILFKWSNGGPWQYNIGGSGTWHTVEDPGCVEGRLVWNATTGKYDIRVAFQTPQTTDVVASFTTNEILDYAQRNLALRISVAPNGTSVNTSGTVIAFSYHAISYGAMTTQLQFNSSYLNVKLGSTALANGQWLNNGDYINIKYKNATYNTTYNFKKYIITRTKQDDSTDSEDSTSTTTYNTLDAETYKKYRYQVQYAFDTNYVEQHTITDSSSHTSSTSYSMSQTMNFDLDSYNTNYTVKLYMYMQNTGEATTPSQQSVSAATLMENGVTWTINGITVKARQNQGIFSPRNIVFTITPYRPNGTLNWQWISKIEISVTKNATGDSVIL